VPATAHGEREARLPGERDRLGDVGVVGRPDDDGGAGVGAAHHHGADRVVVGVVGLDHPTGDAGAQVGDGGGRVGGGPGGVDRGGLVGGGPGHAAFLLVGGVMHLAMHGSTAGTSETDRG